MTDLDEAIVSARPPARQRDAVLASVRARLFADTSEQRIDRYIVERRLGQGGMGVVWAARDPRLGRHVAIKVLRGPERPNDRARLLREAQALARLSHPNVVEIYDVGMHGRQVFLAMELIEGRTLASWLARPRPWRAVVDVFIAAGRGLEAAHAAELVHRDFKPHNVMLAEDGRVRVMDFGLAHHHAVSTDRGDEAPRGAWLDASLTATGQRVGTPAYMAPEQHDGGIVDARTDQFGFCAALYEGLVGVPPFRGDTLATLAELKRAGRIAPAPPDHGAPASLLALVRKGLAPDPAARHPSMAVLLAAIERHVRGRSRRVLAIAATAAAVLGVAAFAVPVHDRNCDDDPQRLWGEHGRARVVAAFAALDPSWGTATGKLTIAALDRHARLWSAANTRVCSGAALDDSLRDRARACLDRDRHEFTALVTELGDAHIGGLGQALGASGALPDPSRCSDPIALARSPTAPRDPAIATRVATAREQLAHAWALQRLDRFDRAREMLAELDEEAAQLGDPALSAEVSFARGNALLDEGDPAALDMLRRAYFAANECDHWTIAAEAATMLVFAIGSWDARPEEGLDWARHAEIALAQAPDPTLRAELDTNVGSLLEVRGDHDAARTRFRSAIAAIEPLGEHADSGTALQYLALSYASTGELAEARTLLVEAIEQRTRRLGAMHALVAAARVNLANVLLRLGELEAALEQHRVALAIQEAMLGPRHLDVAVQRGNLGALLEAMGDDVAAREQHVLALDVLEQILGPDHPYVGATLVNLGRLDVRTGALDRAQRELERARSVLEPALGSAHPHLGFALLGLGELAIARADSRRALAVLGPAQLACSDADAMLCAEIDFQRARALALAGDRDGSRAAATHARTRAGEGDEADRLRARIDSWSDQAERSG
ncbi:MAG TPA: serine/threonine-protein kinase [Nannocystaceae bacterium]|nr:serine/threonine-protein kinase [Nannocystaceae bacterium]